MKELFKSICEFLIIISFAAIAVFGIISVFEQIGSWKCGKYEDVSGRPTKYVFYDQCYVEAKGTWYTMDEYKMSIAAKDSFSFEVE